MPMLKPFFTFYGGKWRAAPRYPKPEHKIIIEGFAGAAGYSVRHYEREIRLYEVDPIIAGLWDYLIHVKRSEIIKLPLIVDHVDNLKVCQEAKWLIGFWLNKGTTGPRNTPSAWMRSGISPNTWWGQAIRDRVASQVNNIRHWKVFNTSYRHAPDIEATWFIDAPYQSESGSRYRYRFTAFRQLGSWCKRRKGQVIVCEQEGADWLPFKPFITIKTLEGKYGKSTSKEAIWIK